MSRTPGRAVVSGATLLALSLATAMAAAQAQPEAAAPPQPAPAATTGRLRVVVNRPGTRVWLAGRDVGLAPLELDLVPRQYELRLEAPGQRPWSGRVDVVTANRISVRAMLAPSPPRSWAWTSTAVAGISAVLALTFGLVSNANFASAQADRAQGWLDNHDSRIERGSALAIGADTALATTLLFSALAIYFFVDGPGERSSARVGRPRPLSSGLAAEAP